MTLILYTKCKVMRTENVIIDKKGNNLLVTVMVEDYVYSVAMGNYQHIFLFLLFLPTYADMFLKALPPYIIGLKITNIHSSYLYFTRVLAFVELEEDVEARFAGKFKLLPCYY